MQIKNLPGDNDALVRQAAMLLVEEFREHWPDAWPTLADALSEVGECVQPDRICRAAWVGERLAGWIGGQPLYSGHVWELHPLVVGRAFQRQGVGRALVLDLEDQVRQRGGLTLWVGTDDEQGLTSLAGADLYPDLLTKLGQIQNLKGHPFTFYQRLGFVLAGIVPDANGRGKPDILLAKPIR